MKTPKQLRKTNVSIGFHQKTPKNHCTLQKFQNFQKITVDLLISDGQKDKVLSPSKNIYQPSGQVTNEVSTTNKLFSQYYATISTIESNKVGINLVYKPFINLLWLSAIMLIFSIFLSVVKKR